MGRLEDRIYDGNSIQLFGRGIPIFNHPAPGKNEDGRYGKGSRRSDISKSVANHEGFVCCNPEAFDGVEEQTKLWLTTIAAINGRVWAEVTAIDQCPGLGKQAQHISMHFDRLDGTDYASTNDCLIGHDNRRVAPLPDVPNRSECARLHADITNFSHVVDDVINQHAVSVKEDCSASPHL